MVKRAIKSFREQTYGECDLLLYDTAVNTYRGDRDGIITVRERHVASIGTLRNWANHYASPEEYDVLCHWDSDDWSHPRRIEEQVALLQASGKQCVGYRDMIFYDTTPGQFCGAWLYRHPTKPLGTSLMYWRSVWEARPFPDLPKAKGGTGEDVQWLEGVDHLAVTAFLNDKDRSQPRMIASIHGGNTQHYDPVEYEKLSNGTSWKRAAEWDYHCKSVMAP